MAQQETSALFSLKELMRIEETRIEEEREARRRQAEAAERVRQEAERAARERELARLRFEEQRRRDEEVHAREEAARLEALRAAEVERVRVDALERAKAAALSARREHEQRLAAIGAGETKKRLRWTVWLGAAGFLALVATGAGVYFGQIKPNADLRARGLEAIILERRLETEQMQKSLDEQNRKVKELQDRVNDERDANRPVAADVKPAAPKPAVRPRVQKVRPPPASCTCDPHDPLCGCFAPR